MEEKGLEIAELVMTWFARTADTPMRCTYCVSFVYWSAFVPHLRKMYFFPLHSHSLEYSRDRYSKS